MESLPDELVLNIFKHAEPHVIKALRLAGRRYSRIGFDSLFGKLRLLMIGHDMRKIMDLCRPENDLLTDAVTSLYIEADQPRSNTMDDPDGAERWEWSIDLRNKPQLPPFPNPTWQQQLNYFWLLARYHRTPRHSFSPSQLDEHWEYHNRLFIDEYIGATRLPNIRLPQFVVLCTRLRRLKTLTIDLNSTFEPQSVRSHELFDPALGPRSKVPKWTFWLVDQLLRELSWSQNFSLENLFVGPGYWEHLHGIGEGLKNSYAQSCQNLRRITLYIQIAPLHQGQYAVHQNVAHCYQFLKAGQIKRWLEAAPKLREIRLEFLIPFDAVERPPLNDALLKDPYTDSYGARMQDIFAKNCRFYNLRTLALARVECTESEFLDFVSRHQSTLTRVELDNILLSEGTWIGLFGKLRDIITLTDIKLAGTFYSKVDKEAWSLKNETDDIFNQTAWNRTQELQDWICRRGVWAGEGPNLEDQYSWKTLLALPPGVRPQDDIEFLAIFGRDRETELRKRPLTEGWKYRPSERAQMRLEEALNEE